MQNKNYIILSLFVLIFCASTQLSFAQKNMTKANMYYNSQLYAQAIEYFKSEIESADEVVKREAMIKLAKCYKQTGMFIEAEDIYKKLMYAYGKKEPNFIFEYANALRSSSKYAEAIQMFEQYKKVRPKDPMTDQCIQSCILAEQWLIEEQTKYVQLVPGINSISSDISPVLVGDTLVFSSSREGCVKKLVDVTDGGKSTMLDLFYTNLLQKPLVAANDNYLNGLNTYMHEGPATFTQNGNMVYFTRTVRGKKEKKGVPVALQIFTTTRNSAGKWLPAQSAFSFNSTKYSVAHPTISKDGNRIYYVSDIPGGKGGTDIYMVSKVKGVWGKPQNLGPKINTLGNELTPYLHNDTTLYFSSDFHPGMGKKDIFVAYYRGNEWKDVENLRPPINSLANDFGFVLYKNGESGFFTSDRFNGLGSEDIYSFIENKPLLLTYNLPQFEIMDNSFFNQSSFQLEAGENTEKIEIQSSRGQYSFSVKDTSMHVLNERREGLSFNKVAIQFVDNKEAYYELYIKPSLAPVLFQGYIKNPFTIVAKDSAATQTTTYKPVEGVKVELYARNKLVEEAITDKFGKYVFNTQFDPRKQYKIIAYKNSSDFYEFNGIVVNQDTIAIPNAEVFFNEKNKIIASHITNYEGTFSFKANRNESYRIVARANKYLYNYVNVEPTDNPNASLVKHVIFLKSQNGAKQSSSDNDSQSDSLSENTNFVNDGSLTQEQMDSLQSLNYNKKTPIVNNNQLNKNNITKRFYTVLLVASQEQRAIATLQKEYGITDSIIEYYDGKLYNYIVGNFDSLSQAKKLHDTKLKYLGGSVKCVIEGQYVKVTKGEKHVVIQGQVLDEDKQPLVASIEFSDTETKANMGTIQSDKLTGNYETALQVGINYGMYISHAGYIFHSENINLKDSAEIYDTKVRLYKNIQMKPATVGNSVVLNNIFFDFGKSVLRKSSLSELEKVLLFMLDNPNIRVEISGHTCNTGTYAYNKRLSEARANAVTRFLVDHGINRKRILSIGYSYDRPIRSNDTESEKQYNRRTEFKIIGN